MDMSLTFFVEAFLWVVVVGLAVLALARGKILFREATRDGTMDFLRTLPRIFLGVVGSGFLAEVIPQDLVVRSIGPESGMLGVLIATVLGAVTPGGAVVGFAIAATALRSGGGAPQIIAYATAWALFAIQRVVVWELPTVEARVVWLRVAASLPLPFLAAIGAMLIGRP